MAAQVWCGDDDDAAVRMEGVVRLVRAMGEMTFLMGCRVCGEGFKDANGGGLRVGYDGESSVLF